MTAPAIDTTPAPGVYPGARVYPGASMQDYHSWNCASNSRLSRIRQSPAHLRAYLDQPSKDTDALRLGRAIHSAILEPDDFATSFTLAAQCDATKKGDGQRCSNMGILFNGGWFCGVHGKGMASDETRTILSADDYAVCLGTRDSVHAHPAANGLLSGLGDVELSAVWADAETGASCKGRFDRHAPSVAGGTIVDIKTTSRSAARSDFERTIFSYRYFVQGAHYMNGAAALAVPAEHFVIIAVETVVPYACAVYRLTEGVLQAGSDEIRRLLPIYAECMASGIFPGYPDEVQDISLPNYAWGQLNEAIT